MARPNKEGLDYFPLDVDLDQDDKLAMIIGEFGDKGELLYIKLLGWIYKHGGYRITWNEQELLKFAKRVSYIGGAPANLIKEIVARCIKWGLFNKPVFDSFQILTSERIQSTWLDATRKRKGRIVEKAIWLIPEGMELIPPETKTTEIKTELTGFIPPLTTQSKVKESKVKESGEGEPPPPLEYDWPGLDEKQRWVAKQMKILTEGVDLPNDYISSEAKKLILKKPEAPYPYIITWSKNIAEGFVKPATSTTQQTNNDHKSERQRLEEKTRKLTQG